MTGQGEFCDIAEPHIFSEATIDTMTDAELRQEYTHNETGRELCAW